MKITKYYYYTKNVGVRDRLRVYSESFEVFAWTGELTKQPPGTQLDGYYRKLKCYTIT